MRSARNGVRRAQQTLADAARRSWGDIPRRSRTVVFVAVLVRHHDEILAVRSRGGRLVAPGEYLCGGQLPMDVTMVQFVRQTGVRLSSARIETLVSDAFYREVVIGVSGTLSDAAIAAIGSDSRALWVDRDELIAIDRHAAAALNVPRRSWPAA